MENRVVAVQKSGGCAVSRRFFRGVGRLYGFGWHFICKKEERRFGRQKNPVYNRVVDIPEVGHGRGQG